MSRTNLTSVLALVASLVAGGQLMAEEEPEGLFCATFDVNPDCSDYVCTNANCPGYTVYGTQCSGNHVTCEGTKN
ncbi:MAG: hypothetical protein KA267_04265 [Gemmatimonadales bacterium]|jgi:hypothetical protein|nr:hypothetical protein [Gemmatimonadales bacterium]MBP7619627.1 hypothetical protein [Gemmatimonadales bacterium]MBP9896954.1 hypothetical protein [Gemmatimonadales bacterium]